MIQSIKHEKLIASGINMDYCEDSLRKGGILLGYFLGSVITGKPIETSIEKTEELAKGIKFKESLEKCTRDNL